MSVWFIMHRFEFIGIGVAKTTNLLFRLIKWKLIGLCKQILVMEIVIVIKILPCILMVLIALSYILKILIYIDN